MSTLTQITNGSWIPWVGLTLSFIAAGVYFIIASPARPERYKSPPTPVPIVAGPAYLIGACSSCLATAGSSSLAPSSMCW